MSVDIRNASPEDVSLIREFIVDLARYEKLEHEATCTEDELHATLFGDRQYAEVVIAECEGKPAGFAVYFYNYSTFLAKPGLYLEDLFVDPGFRGRGIGQRLLTWLAQTAVEQGCGRLEWSVLDWNEPAIAFYRSIGAESMDDWRLNRLTGEPLKALARGRAE